MARTREQQKPGDKTDAKRAPSPDDQSVLSELTQRAIAMGLSGLLFTESTIRKAVGETLPKEWSDFAVDQSERTRKEFLDRLTFEIGQTLEKIDIAAVLAELMRGRTLDINASIRLTDGEASNDTDDEAPTHTFRVRLAGDKPDED